MPARKKSSPRPAISGSTWLVIERIAAELGLEQLARRGPWPTSCSSRGVHGGSAPMKTLNSSSGSRNSRQPLRRVRRVAQRPRPACPTARTPRSPTGRRPCGRRGRSCPSGPEGQHRVRLHLGHDARSPGVPPRPGRRRRTRRRGSRASGARSRRGSRAPLAISAVRTAASGAPLGQRSSSGEPSSPRVAVMQTTRSPARTARAISPAHSQVSSSGCAQTPRIVPRGLSAVMARTVVALPGDGACDPQRIRA